MTNLIDDDAVIGAFAKKLHAFRLAVMPRRSRREAFYTRWIRPALVALLVKRQRNKNNRQHEENGEPAAQQEKIDKPAVKSVVKPVVLSYKVAHEHRDAVKEILVIKCDHIGDFVLSWQAISILKKGFPRARLTLLCSSWNQDLALQTGLFDRVACVDIFPEMSSAAPLRFNSAALAALDLPVFDIAVDLKADADTQFLLNHVEARLKAGFENPHIDNDAPDAVPLDFAFRTPSRLIAGASNRARHTQVLLASLAAAIVQLYEDPAASLEAFKPSAEKTGRLTLARRGAGPVIGINTGSGAPTRNWPLENYTALVGQLTRLHDATIVLIGARYQQEDAAIVAQGAPAANIVNLVGTVPLAELPSVIRQLDLYIGHDTGITHLAGVLGQKTLCLHAGVTPTESFGPVGRDVVVLKCVELPCAPCGLQKLSHCSYDHRCMRLITVAKVLEEIETMLDLSGSGLEQRKAIGASA